MTFTPVGFSSVAQDVVLVPLCIWPHEEKDAGRKIEPFLEGKNGNNAV